MRVLENTQAKKLRQIMDSSREKPERGDHNESDGSMEGSFKYTFESDNQESEEDRNHELSANEIRYVEISREESEVHVVLQEDQSEDRSPVGSSRLSKRKRKITKETATLKKRVVTTLKKSLRERVRVFFTQAKKIPRIKDNLDHLIAGGPVPSESYGELRQHQLDHWKESHVNEVQPFPAENPKDNIVYQIDKMPQRDQSLLFKWILRRPRGRPPRCTNCVMARHTTVRHIQACTGYDIDSMILESRFRDALTCIVDTYSRCLGGVNARYPNSLDSLAATRGLGYYNDGSSGSEEEEWIEIEPSMVDPAGPIQVTDGSVLGIRSVQ